MEDLLLLVANFADNPYALFFALFAGALTNTFFPPIPVELGTVFAGYMASEGHGSLFVIISAATLGMFSGTVVFYRLSKVYGTAMLNKPYFAQLVSVSSLKRMEVWVQKYGAIALFASKFVPGMYFCAIFASAVLPLKKSKVYLVFFFVNLAAFTVLAFIGKMAGEHWRDVYAVLGKTGGLSLAALILAAAAIYLARKYLLKKP